MFSKKMIYGFILSLFFMNFSANAADLNEILKNGEVKIAVPEAFAPFGSVGKTGEHEGYDVDVAKLIAKDLGVKLKIVPVVSKQRIPFLETDKVDLVISTMGANPSRAKSINFSSAYAPFYSGVFAPSSIKVSSYADLDGLTIGVTGGTLEDLELTKMAPKGAKITRFGDNAATLSAIKSKQVQVLVAGNTVAASVTEANPDFDLERNPELVVSYIYLLQYIHDHRADTLTNIEKPEIVINNTHLCLTSNSIRQLNVIHNYSYFAILPIATKQNSSIGLVILQMQ